MRKTTRMQSAQALALASVCAIQLAAPGLTQAQTPPATPVPTTPAPTAPAAPPAVAAPAAPVQPSAAGQAAPAVAVAPAPEAPQPELPAAAEPTAPAAYAEPINAPVEPAAPAPLIEAAPVIDEQLVAEPKSKVPTYIMWGVGGASMITGAVLGITALTAKSDFDDAPTYAAADKVEGRAVAADIALGLGAVLLVTGTVFYFLPDSQQERPTASNPKRTAARVQVAPMFGRTNGGSVSIQF